MDSPGTSSQRLVEPWLSGQSPSSGRARAAPTDLDISVHEGRLLRRETGVRVRQRRPAGPDAARPDRPAAEEDVADEGGEDEGGGNADDSPYEVGYRDPNRILLARRQVIGVLPGGGVRDAIVARLEDHHRLRGVAFELLQGRGDGGHLVFVELQAGRLSLRRRRHCQAGERV